MDRFYRNFFLRDILAYTLPGFLFVAGIWFMADPYMLGATCPTQAGSLRCLINATKVDLSWPQLAFLLGSSFLVGWVLQALHFAFVDWIFQFATQFELHPWRSLVWPLYSTIHHTRAIARGTDRRSEANSLITMGSLAPDKALGRISNNQVEVRTQSTLGYTERLSALMLMVANLVVGGGILVFLAALRSILSWLVHWSPAIGLAVLSFINPVGLALTLAAVALIAIYSEFWRMYYARNLRVEYLVDAANAQSSQTGPGDTTASPS